MLHLVPHDHDGGPAPAGITQHPLFSASRTAHVVLVVDDNAGKRYALTRALRAAGFRILEVAEGASALGASQACSAAVLDVHLPDVDGFSLCRAIREAHPALPIVQVSSVMVEEPFRQAGKEAGADAYLCDPGMEELVATLDTLLASKAPGQ